MAAKGAERDEPRREATAWSFLTVEESDRQFVGNEGYEDVLGRTYTWDDTVPRHGDVRRGDLAVIRDSEFVLGIGWIDQVPEPTPGTKLRYRCEHCNKTSFKERKSGRYEFRYKCSCGKEFNTPVLEKRTNTWFFRADYSQTWQPLDTALRVKEIDPAYLKNGKQHSIREMNISLVQQIVRDRQAFGETWWIEKPEHDDDVEIKGGHVVTTTRARIGQQHFRQKMLARFGQSCAICGSLPGAMLEAAHLYRYADVEKHDVKGGLLLRRDLHALFDRGMLLIDTDDGWRIRLDPRLAGYPELWNFDGQALAVPASSRPRERYLREHALFARQTWAEND